MTENGASNIPARIFLQVTDEIGDELGTWERTWCVDKIHETDIEYVLAPCGEPSGDVTVES